MQCVETLTNRNNNNNWFYSQLPSSSKNVYEAWTLIYRRPNRRLQGWTKFLWYKFRKTVRTEPGKVLALNPKVHFEQEELSDVINQAKVQYRPRSNRRTSGTSATYDEDVERRLRTLEIPVQDELYKLLRDRAEHASNSYRRREYKLVVLLEVPGGEMTDAGTGPQAVNKNKNKRTLRDVWKGKAAVQAPHVEYRVILRGSEVKTNAAGWGIYNRYAQPWRLADEIDVINAREKSGYQELLG